MLNRVLTIGHVLIFMTAALVIRCHAIEVFKVSNYGGGHQIWFEAEHFDERIPEGGDFFPVTGEKDAPETPDEAFGKAVTRAGGAGGTIVWNFDISRAGGTGGNWYFWARLSITENRSDYLLVLGDPDDEIPDGPPFPGGNVAPFDDMDDMVFEVLNIEWDWTGVNWNGLGGHIKELQNGLNTMYMFHREGDSTTLWDVFMWADNPDYKPSDNDYMNASEKQAAVQLGGKLPITWSRLKKNW